jgi:hypothetical protein
MGKDLKKIYEDDQKDRQDPKIWETESEQINYRDRQRLKLVKDIVSGNGLTTGEEYYWAAMVCQHGKEIEDYELAHKLATRSMEMGYEPAKWLVAASLDRWLVAQGKIQKYGTQYLIDNEGKRTKLPTDPTTTDKERRELNVPSDKQPEE